MRLSDQQAKHKAELAALEAECRELKEGTESDAMLIESLQQQLAAAVQERNEAAGRERDILQAVCSHCDPPLVNAIAGQALQLRGERAAARLAAEQGEEKAHV